MLQLLYVDDIILTGNQPSQMSSSVHTFGEEFELSDLDHLSYFFGLEATFSLTGLSLSQLKYIIYLLKEFSMTIYQLCAILVCAKMQLFTHNGDFLPDATEYWQLVVSLQYLTFTQPDIANSINHIAQCMSQSQLPHLLEARRILRYLKSIVDFGHFFQRTAYL